MLEKALGYGYKNIGFILDQGYFSKENIHFMDKCGFDFVIMVKGMKKFVSGLIFENNGKFEENRTYSIREYNTNGMTVKEELFPSDKTKRYFHIYYNSSKYASEREKLEAKIDQMAKNLKNGKGKLQQLKKSMINILT